MSLACRCHSVQQEKDGKGQVLAEKIETSQGKKQTKQNYIRLILHLFLLRGYALVDWLPQIQRSNVTRELFLTPAW